VPRIRERRKSATLFRIKKKGEVYYACDIWGGGSRPPRGEPETLGCLCLTWRKNGNESLAREHAVMNLEWSGRGHAESKSGNVVCFFTASS
jgi:hypothetical protein